MSSERYVGLMSGTSMDGIDAVLLELDSLPPRILDARTVPWTPALRERLQSAASGTLLSADQFAQLDAEIGEAFAAAALAVIPEGERASVTAIGSHGQTLAHGPHRNPAYSLQLGDPARIAERTGITTVGYFRQRDIAAGGQGAPLAPAFHQAMFAEPGRRRAVVNIGGIANLTRLDGDEAEAALGFDTGPGNCLMDGWCLRYRGQAYDRDGGFAASGRPDPELLEALQGDPYFSAPPPKSTGTDYFSGAWVQHHLEGRDIDPADVQATLLALTADTVAQAIQTHADGCERVLVCGGGAHNPALMRALGERLSCPVTSTAALGLDPDWVEGAAFAWLARQTLRGQPGNLATVTGAGGPRILGAIFPA